MAFKKSDFKKTTRRVGDTRVLYPYQIRDDRYTAAIGYAIAYFERMVGRRRAEFETETLLEFFGDTRLARGLVACLGRTYVWHTPTFGEVFGDATARALRGAGLVTPANLRARLYGLANGRYGGVILPDERAEALVYLCRDLPLDTDQFERALALDAEDERVLVKRGPTPTVQEIIARYNYHSLETALCHADTLRLRLHGPIWSIVRSVHNLTRRYRVQYQVGSLPRTLFDDQIDVTLAGGRDALGRWSRTGRRLIRALLRLLATHPDSLVAGEATVHVGSQASVVRLDERALRVLGVAAQATALESEPWEEEVIETFRKAWGRAFMRGTTDGWRLRRDPEPLVGAGVVVVPDFALQRGHERVAVCLASNRATARTLIRDLKQLGSGVPAIIVARQQAAEGLPTRPVPLVAYTDQPVEALRALVAMLEQQRPRSRAAVTLTPWQRLERLVGEEGFVTEAMVAAILNCRLDEAAHVVQRWGGPALHVLPGVGVCAPEALDDIRALIEQSDIAPQAA